MAPRRLFTIVVGLLYLAGCARGWKSRPVEPALADLPSGDVRLTLNDGRLVIMRDPTREQDSLVGLSGMPRERTAIAVSDIAQFEVENTSTTLALIAVGAVAFVAGAALLLALPDWCKKSKYGTGSCPN